MCRISQTGSSGSRVSSCEPDVRSTSSTVTSDAMPVSSAFVSEVSETDRTTKDSSRLSAFLNRLRLSLSLAEYTSLLRSVNPLYNSATESARGSVTCASQGVGLDDVATQEVPTFVPRTLSDIGLNSLMTMKKRLTTSPHSALCFLPSGSGDSRSSLSSSREFQTVSSSSSTPCQSISQPCHAAALDVDVENHACSPAADELLRLGTGPPTDEAPGDPGLFPPTLQPSVETSLGHCVLSNCEQFSEEVFRTTVPSVTVTPNRQTAPPCVEPGRENTVSSSEGRRLSAVRRPQTLDVIPWASLSPSEGMMIDSLCTVAYCSVGSSSNRIHGTTVNVSAL